MIEMNTAAALALNNIGLSLVRHDCHELAIAAFCDSLSLLRCPNSPESVTQMMNKANQFLACWKDFLYLREDRYNDHRPGLRICRKDIPYDCLATLLREDLEASILSDTSSFHLILLHFAETPAVCSGKAISDSAVMFESVVLNNLASALVCAWEQQPHDLQYADKALDIWGQSAILLEKTLFDGVFDDSLRSKVSSLHVFVLRCIERTATVLGLTLVAAEAYNQTMNEYSYFCAIDDEECSYKIPKDIAAASAA